MPEEIFCRIATSVHFSVDATDLSLDSDQLVAKATVKRHAAFVVGNDSGDRVVNAALATVFFQSPLQQVGDATSDRVGVKIDRCLACESVSVPQAIQASRCPANHGGILHRDEPSLRLWSC